jgi:hypothetical protein
MAIFLKQISTENLGIKIQKAQTILIFHMPSSHARAEQSIMAGLDEGIQKMDGWMDGFHVAKPATN